MSDQMVLVVANQTLGGEALLAYIREAISWGMADFYLVVPATPIEEQIAAQFTDPVVQADARLQVGLQRFAAEGARISGQVGSADPVKAVADVLERLTCTEIVVSTLPPHTSRWIERSLAAELRDLFHLPVTSVVAWGEGGAEETDQIVKGLA